MKTLRLVITTFLFLLVMHPVNAQNLVQNFIENNSGNGTTYLGYSVSSAGDVNNDGYSDVIVGAFAYSYNTGRVYIYYGGSDMDNVADVIMTGEARRDNFGISIAGIGDVNGDGFDDVIVGAEDFSSYKGRSYIFYGGSSMDNVADVIMTGGAKDDSFGCSVSGAGDVNNDGFNDVLVGAWGCKRTYVFLGGSQMDGVADKIIYDKNGAYSGIANAGVGDVNGDGFDDIAIGFSTSIEKICLFFGGDSIDDVADVTITAENNLNISNNIVSSAGDVNGDGFDDVIVGTINYNSRTGRAYIFFGGQTMDAKADVVMTGEGNYNEFGNSVSGAGDVNNDGYDDVVIGANSYYSDKGRAYIFFGGAKMDNVSDVVFTGENTYNDFGSSVSGAGDVNNDGYDDVIIGASGYLSNTGRAYIYYGSSGMSNVAKVVITGESTNNNFGVSISGAGDVNGDGFEDVIIGANGYNSNTGRAYIYYGGVNFDNVPDVILTGKEEQSNLGISVSGVGDVNGDGFDDVIVGGYNDYYSGYANLYYGGTSMDSVADLTLEGEGEFFGTVIAGAGDVNDDGYNDLIAGDPLYSVNKGQAYIYLGGTAMDNIPDVTMTGEDYSNYFGCSVSGAGDVNGDGYDDVVIGAGGNDFKTGNAYVYYGGSTMDNVSDVVLTGENHYDYFGSSVSGASDVNSDGYDDIIVGASGYDAYRGRAYIFFGGKRMDNIPDVSISGEDMNNEFGAAVSGVGDVNGDGYDDIIVGASYYDTDRGRAYIFFGGKRMDNIPDVSISGEDINNEFGAAVSGVGDVNGDGYPEFIIGAKNYSTNGKAYIYNLNQNPQVSTGPANSIESFSATLNGTLISLGNSTPDAHGFCWNKSGKPDISSDTVNLGAITIPGSFSWQITELIPGTTYFARAYATNKSGAGYGNEISFTTPKASQTISFAPLETATLNEEPFRLLATSTSGLPVIFTSSDTSVAIIQNDTLLITGVGITTITASQPGNSQYEAAPDVVQPFEVVKPFGSSSLIKNVGLSFMIIPNPNTGSFTLELTNFEPQATVTIYNLLGEKIARYNQSVETLRPINFEGIRKGIYFVEVSDGKNKMMMKKMIVK
jgi:hypothetical protein